MICCGEQGAAERRRKKTPTEHVIRNIFTPNTVFMQSAKGMSATQYIQSHRYRFKSSGDVYDKRQYRKMIKQDS